MYATLLTVHNLLRWAVLLGGLYAITKSVLGIMHKRDFTKQENLSHALFVGFCHLQLVLGLILYFISPVVEAALAGADRSLLADHQQSNRIYSIGHFLRLLQNMGAAMKDPASRFVAVEHISTMIIAIVLIQVGRTLSKKQTEAMAKHKKAVVFFSIGLILILSRIPWKAAMWPL
jgi:hypothetical protein